MTLTYLEQPAAIQFDATGTGIVEMSPPSGQYWLPTMLKVSTVANTPTAYAAVYMGPPSTNGATLDNSQFIDDTFLGSGDVTTMVSGLTVQYGTTLTVKFANGAAFDTGYVTLFGVASDLPPNLGTPPQVPGTHFSGHIVTVVEKLTAIASSPLNIATGALPVPFPSSGTVDMRQFSSYSLQVQSLTLGANLDSCLIDIVWSANPDGSVVLSEQTYEIWVAGSATQVFSNNFGNTMFQDIRRGPFLRVSFTNLGPDTINLQGTRLYLSTRDVPTPIAQDRVGDGVMAHAINAVVPAGNILKVPCLLYPGNALAVFRNNGTSQYQFLPNQGTLSTNQQYAVNLASTLTLNPMFTGRRACRIDVNGTAGEHVDIEVYSLYNKQV